jgi:hypothetical protein
VKRIGAVAVQATLVFGRVSASALIGVHHVADQTADAVAIRTALRGAGVEPADKTIWTVGGVLTLTLARELAHAETVFVLDAERACSTVARLATLLATGAEATRQRRCALRGELTLFTQHGDRLVRTPRRGHHHDDQTQPDRPHEIEGSNGPLPERRGIPGRCRRITRGECTKAAQHPFYAVKTQRKYEFFFVA